jgi:hypothetical protein
LAFLQSLKDVGNAIGIADKKAAVVLFSSLCLTFSKPHTSKSAIIPVNESK